MSRFLALLKYMDTIISCLNCSEELLHIKENNQNDQKIEILQTFQSMQAYQEKRFVRCRICGFSGTLVPASLVNLLNEALETDDDRRGE